MSQKGFFVGVGAAGNKAVIHLVEEGIVSRDDILLINTTTKDIPTDYRDDKTTIKLEGSIGGCGKERTKAKDLTLKALKNGSLDLKRTVDNTYAMVVIIASMEGGSGSGAAPLIAKFYSEVVNIKTHIIAFKGFGEDIRGWQNTVEFFQDLSKDVTLQIIENKKFLEEENRTMALASVKKKQSAERGANVELMKRVKIMLGQMLSDSDQNMDQMDIYKAINIPGFMTIEYREVTERIKNRKEFDELLTDMLDSSKTIDTIIPSQKRMAVIINIPENERDGIDYRFTKVRERLGEHVYEYFTHFQYDPVYPKFIAFISSGINMPIEEVNIAYERYMEESNALPSSTEDDFFAQALEYKGNDRDFVFNTDIPTVNPDEKAEEDFFKQFIKQPNKKK